MKILADQNIPHAEAFFGHLGEVVRAPGRDLTPAQLADIDALIVRSVTQVNAALIGQSPVQFVGTCTIGTDHLDIAYLNQRQISWASAQGCNANSVVEYVVAALSYSRPQWLSKTIGIIGCGNVGGRLRRRLLQLGVSVRVYDPFLNSADVPELADLSQVLAADIVCLHTPLTKTGPHPTEGLIGAAELAAMPSGALILNAGRGEVVQGRALAAHLHAHSGFTAVLDVWENEPCIDTALMQQVAIATPHIAGYSYDGKVKGTEMIYQALCAHLGVAPNVRAAQVMPPQEPALVACVPGSGVGRLTPILAQAYDIQADDRAMRGALQSGTDTAPGVGQAFDELRKHYPQRREWHHFACPQDTAGPLRNVLTILGFKIQ